VNWSLAKAKDNLSEVVRRARAHGPQTISIRGEDAAVVMSKELYDELRKPDRPRDFKEWLLSLKGLADDLDLERDKTPVRDLEL
jgi:prevent-host-death family protein